MNTSQIAVRLSVVSAFFFAFLVALQLGSGTSQHAFEVVHPAAVYAEKLVAHRGWLTAIVALDDLFITCYVGAALFAVLALPKHPLGWLVMAGALAGGLLDLEENHHMLAMLRAAQNGIVLDPGEIIRRMDFSSIKWVIAHMAFFFLAFLLPGRTALVRWVRASCWFLQLPVGVAGVVYADVLWLQLFRAANMFTGFLILGLIISRLEREAVAVAAGSGAPGSRPGMRPGVAG